MYVVNERTESAVPGHHESAGCAADEIFLNVKPFIRFFEVFRLVRFDPFIFPDRVFYAGRNRARYHYGFDQLEHVCSRNLEAVRYALFDFFFRSLIHIAHRTTDGVAFLVDKHQTLHLAAETYALDVGRLYVGLMENSFCRNAHCVPPFVCVLLGAAVFENVKIVAAHCRLNQPDFLVDFKQTGFDAGRANVVSYNKSSHNILRR